MSSRSHNVLLLCEYATLLGGEQSMLSTFEGIAAAGFTPTVICPAEGRLRDTLRSRGVETLSLAMHDDSGRRLALDEIRQALAELLKRRRGDLLHANSLSMGRLSGPVAAELGLASIAHLRDIIRISGQAMKDLNRHRRLLAVSEATRQYHVAAGMTAERTHVLHNGVDLQRFHPRKPDGYLHRELGLPPGVALIGTIGQIGLRKGQDVVAQAARIVAEDAPDVHYLFVGERYSGKDESRRFEADLRAADSGQLEGRLHFLGFRDDVDRLLGELTMLVHPARQEPLGRVLLEAAASGTPVIATDVGGTREIFPPESAAARLVPPDQPETLARAIRGLLDDEPLRIRMAAAARQRAEEAFHVDRAVEGLVEHYRATLEG